jgi:hypothetical protein
VSEYYKFTRELEGVFLSGAHGSRNSVGCFAESCWCSIKIKVGVLMGSSNFKTPTYSILFEIKSDISSPISPFSSDIRLLEKSIFDFLSSFFVDAIFGPHYCLPAISLLDWDFCMSMMFLQSEDTVRGSLVGAEDSPMSKLTSCV